MAVLDHVQEYLDKKIPVREGDWNPKEIEFLNTLLFITAKPVVYLINIGRNEYITKKNKFLPKIAGWIKENGGGPMIPFSAEFEKEVSAAAGSADNESVKRLLKIWRRQLWSPRSPKPATTTCA
jgi:obg-like ATPase 1